MNTVTMLGIEVQIRDTVEIDPTTPFIMIPGELSVDQQYRKIYPLWLQAIIFPSPTQHMEERSLLSRRLLNMMVWNKPISQHQRRDTYRDLPGARANMIGLYEQLFAERNHTGVYADIPTGNDGNAYLIKSGARYSVFADSVGAAKRFCLRSMEATFHKEAMEAEGFGEAHRATLARLME